MTYRELQAELAKLTPEQLDMDATVSCDISEEALPVNYFHCIHKDDMLADVLEAGQPIIAIAF